MNDSSTQQLNFFTKAVDEKQFYNSIPDYCCIIEFETLDKIGKKRKERVLAYFNDSNSAKKVFLFNHYHLRQALETVCGKNRRIVPLSSKMKCKIENKNISSIHIHIDLSRIECAETIKTSFID